MAVFFLFLIWGLHGEALRWALCCIIFLSQPLAYVVLSTCNILPSPHWHPSLLLPFLFPPLPFLHANQPSVRWPHSFFSHLDAYRLAAGNSECPGTHFVFLGLFCRFLLLFTMDSCHIWILNSSLNFPILGLHLIVTPVSLPITACPLNSLTLPDHLLRKPKAAALCSLELCVSGTLHLFLVSCLFFFIKTR